MGARYCSHSLPTSERYSSPSTVHELISPRLNISSAVVPSGIIWKSTVSSVTLSTSQ